MIITCEECSTRFNLDESILKAGGSKVRCSLCKHIFTAFPEVPAPMASEPEEDIEFDLPEDTAPGNLETDDFETDDFEADDSGSDFEETDFEETFEMDGLDFETEETSLDTGGISFEMDVSDPDATDIEINFDPEADALEAEGTLEFDEAELTFDEADIEFSDPDQELEVPKDSVDFDSYESESLDQDSLTLELDDTLEITEDDFEADLSFDDDPDADLVFEETGPEQDLAPALETDSSDEQNMTFPDLTMETDDQEASPDEAAGDLDLDFAEDPFESPDQELDSFAFEDEPAELSDSETQFEENIPDALPEDEFSSYDQALDQDTEPEETFQDPDAADETEELPMESSQPEQDTEEELIEEPALDPPELDPGLRRKRKKKSAMGGPVMLLILLFILVAGAYVASMTLGYKIPYLSDVKIPFLESIFKKEVPKKPAPKPVPNEGTVNGRFISNDTAGELFIITGQIKNPAAIPYSHIQVKGTLITKGKVKAKTLTIYCGNIISEEMLKTGNITDISKQLTIKEGSHNSNVNVKPGGSVPFMLVFSSLPDNLENFTVEVVEF